jgi:hypothetical protein
MDAVGIGALMSGAGILGGLFGKKDPAEKQFKQMMKLYGCQPFKKATPKQTSLPRCTGKPRDRARWINPSKLAAPCSSP